MSLFSGHILEAAARTPVAPAAAEMAADEFVGVVQKLLAQGARAVSDMLSGVPAELGLLSALAFFGGLALWLMGARVVKPMFCGVGLTFGGAVGFSAVPMLFDEPIFGFEPHWVGLAVGGLVGVIASIIVMRFTIALAATGVVAVASMLGSAIWLDIERDGDKPTSWSEVAEEASERVNDRNPMNQELLLKSIRFAGDDELVEVGRRAEHAREFVREISSELGKEWNDLKHRDRLLLMGSGFCGGIVGLFCGLTMPRRSAAVVTAMAGSAIWLTNAAWIAEAADSAYTAKIEWTPAFKLGLWIVVSLIGAGWQIMRLRRRRRLLEE